MNELIKVTVNENGEPIVSGRQLHEVLEVATQYKDWFPRMCEYGFIDGIDFCSILSESTGGRPNTAHAIKLDMAKEIAMIQRNEKGKQVRQYFIEVEKKYKQQNISTAIIDSKFLFQLAQTLEEKENKIAELTPKAEFFDAVTESKDAIDIGSAAKVLNMGIGRNNLFKLLREKGVLMNNNQPYQEYCDRGYFRTIESQYSKPDGSIHINIKTVVFQKGLDYIRKILTKNKDIVISERQ